MPGRATPEMLIAVRGTQLNGFSPGVHANLAALVLAGATLYVRGIDDDSTTLTQEPFSGASIPAARKRPACAYLFSASRKVPSVFRGEIVNFLSEVRGAEGLSQRADIQLSVRHLDGVERALIFSFPHGQGQVVYDLHEHWEGSEDPIIARLGDPRIRPGELGPLMVMNQVCGMTGNRLSQFNLTIDDRPANYDYFNITALKSLLSHIAETCPGAHTDFAWTPSYSHPLRSYIDEIKRASGGFVWHGFVRHVDHAAIADSERDLVQGRRAVAEIERRFKVHLQPIMIFPFERYLPSQLGLLRRHRFLASVEVPRCASANDVTPRHLRCSLPCRRDGEFGFAVLSRYPAASLTRDRLLAMGALGLPIIAFAHPDELGLKRLNTLQNRVSRSLVFDEILGFARSKGLPSASLEEIALAASSPVLNAVPAL